MTYCSHLCLVDNALDIASESKLFGETPMSERFNLHLSVGNHSHR